MAPARNFFVEDISLEEIWSVVLDCIEVGYVGGPPMEFQLRRDPVRAVSAAEGALLDCLVLYVDTVDTEYERILKDAVCIIRESPRTVDKPRIELGRTGASMRTPSRSSKLSDSWFEFVVSLRHHGSL